MFRERIFLSFPVVAIGSIPYIIPACGFPAPGDPRCLAYIREHGLTPSQMTSMPGTWLPGLAGVLRLPAST